jgi:hypothetical protein
MQPETFSRSESPLTFMVNMFEVRDDALETAHYIGSTREDDLRTRRIGSCGDPDRYHYLDASILFHTPLGSAMNLSV